MNTTKKSRHGINKIGITKMSFSTDNEDAIKAKRESKNRGFKDTAEYLRHLVHEAVFDTALLEEDLEALKNLYKKQAQV